MDMDLFDFDLPEELIAQTPLPERSASRLMIVDPASGKLANRSFTDLLDYIREGDGLVLNDTKVLPARLLGIKSDTGAKVEVLLLKQEEGDRWETLVKPAKRIKKGTELIFGNGELKAVCVGEKEHGGRDLFFHYEGIFYEVLEALGEMPLPPYIKHSWTIKNDTRRFMPATEVQRRHRRRDCILRKSCWIPLPKKAFISHISRFMSGLAHSGQ